MTASYGLPPECVAWCKSQDADLVVLDDMAPVDLDWWNSGLAARGIPVQLSGRDLDGATVTAGSAFLRRGDVVGSLEDEASDDDLAVLFRAAAWLMDHPRRRRRRVFPAVMTPAAGGEGLNLSTIQSGLRWCREFHPRTEAVAPRGSSRTGWPPMPGVGLSLRSLYLWAVHPGADRPQLIDEYSLASMCRHGWDEVPSIPRFTRRRYRHYCDRLHAWACEAGVSAELVEMWLFGSWADRAIGSAR
jgi:hypothetical protein